ncbi:DnaB-like helicase N-terminal domain-containing protein [Virgibacillus sp. 179-BFC.A HS]|uniref:DnaB-like helicase N-terminal domain-containing protein n=1 Tax=Tigheibacillus jepli TaxID=3035914 RepID=A0ABU5CEH1_9BACI|nr:DnaB-like helicase N-terminal domain-containing protein [Virgibacillus sp. 179-BFC.A HS]MDY0404219.1 DnaB-like helicase N-terminal domain-containing protein [Virgibacillus sp. 179-BFC.A HS]
MNNIFNYEAEASVLGMILVDGTLFKELVLKENHFHDTRHRQILIAMQQVHTQGAGIDLVTVTTALGEGIAKVGGTRYLLEMSESVASTLAFSHHQRLVLEAFRNREARKLALAFAEQPIAAEIGKFIRQLQHLQDERSSEKTTFDHLLEITDEMCNPTDGLSGFQTNFAALDDMTGGMQKGS